MDTIAENIKILQNEIPTGVKLVAISKTNSTKRILEAYNAGHKVFGENKVQELLPKYEQLPKDIEWHMVGHLQTNKVKYIAPFVSLIHSVDSLSLLKEINKQAIKYNRLIPCLLQVYIAKEETKYGLSEEEINTMLDTETYKALNNIDIVGVMGMASFVEDENIIRDEFRNLIAVYNQLKNRFFAGKEGFKEISMGMSSDYKLAIKEGSTIVRVGSKIFGERNYQSVH